MFCGMNGGADRVVSTKAVSSLVERLKIQRGLVVDHEVVPRANHFFEGKVNELMEVVDAYLDKRL